MEFSGIHRLLLYSFGRLAVAFGLPETSFEGMSIWGHVNKNVARIGIIVAGSAPPIEGFKEGLAELGWIEERNVNFAIRVAQGQVDRLPGFASEIVGLNVDVIAVIGAVTVRVVQEATSTIPIVFSVVVEPVGDSLTTIED